MIERMFNFLLRGLTPQERLYILVQPLKLPGVLSLPRDGFYVYESLTEKPAFVPPVRVGERRAHHFIATEKVDGFVKGYLSCHMNDPKYFYISASSLLDRDLFECLMLALFYGTFCKIRARFKGAKYQGQVVR